MILILRGHIRNSFTTPDLYNLIKKIYDLNKDLKIFIHTWCVVSSNISWRNVEANNTNVDEEYIMDYFVDMGHLIQKIIIDDDKVVNVIGNTNGIVKNMRVPILGWKYYCYGKYRIVEHVYANITSDEMVINTRFDVLDNSYSFTEDQITHFIKNNIGKEFKKNVFISDNEICGIDNIYIGTINTMHTLIFPFQYELDKIITKYDTVINPEVLFFRMNNDLFIK
jgi:hypothetical protein